MSVYEIEVPLPPRQLSTNFQFATLAAKMAVSRHIKAYRAIIAGHVSVRCPVRLVAHVRVSLEWHGVRHPVLSKGLYCPRDVGNAVPKALLDGIVDAGIVADDDAKHMSLGSVVVIGHAACIRIGKTKPGIVITLECEEDVRLELEGEN